MRKLLLIICLLPIFAYSQQTYWPTTVPPGSSSFSPTWRIKRAVTDSINQHYLSDGFGYFELYSAVQQNLRFVKFTDSAARLANYLNKNTATAQNVNPVVNFFDNISVATGKSITVGNGTDGINISPTVMKVFVSGNETDYGHNLISWKNLTGGFRQDDIPTTGTTTGNAIFERPNYTGNHIYMVRGDSSNYYITRWFLRNSPLFKGFTTDSSANVITGPHGGGYGLTINPGQLGNSLHITGGFTTIDGFLTVNGGSQFTAGAIYGVAIGSGANSYQFTTDGTGSAFISKNFGAGVQFTGSNITAGVGSLTSLGIGTGSTSIVGKLQLVETATTGTRGINSGQYSNDGRGPRFNNDKYRGVFGTPTTILTGDTVLNFAGRGYTNAETNAVQILGVSAGTVSSGVVPGVLQFKTANSAGALTTGLTIDQNQALSVPGIATFSGSYVRVNSALGIGVVPSSILAINLPAYVTSLSYGTTGIGIDEAVGNYTSTTSSGTISLGSVNSLGVIALSATNPTILSAATTLYIPGTPTASTNVTISNPYSILVNSGFSAFNGGVGVNNNSVNSNFMSRGGTSTVGGQTNAGLLFGGATSITTRVVFNPQTTSTINTNDSYGGTIFGSGVISTPATGTNAWLSNITIKSLSIISGGSTISNTAALIIDGKATAGTNNFGLALIGGANLAMAGSTSGVITTAVQAIAGTYTWTRPNTTPTTGQIEAYALGGNTWVTPALASTSTIHGNSTTTGTATTAVTVTIGSTMANTTYLTTITPKDLLTAVNYYISAQTTTTFTVTFVTAITGSINFDWGVTP